MRIQHLKTFWAGGLLMLLLLPAGRAEPLRQTTIEELKKAKGELEQSKIEAPRRVAPPRLEQREGEAARRASENLERERGLRIQEEILRKLQ
jgi:hypothetical protein